MLSTLATGILVLAAAGAPPSADRVLKGGVVHTLDPQRPTADAVAIAGGAIAAVGAERDVASLIGPGTRVVDLHGATVVPGFHDSHAHLLGIGFAKLNVDLVGAKDYREVVARVAEAVRTRKPGEWIQGRGWHEGKWAEPTPGGVRGFPTHVALSAVSPDNPVVLTRADGHAILVNAKALELMGIGKDTEAPDGGEIIRDAAGAPTGVLVDNATSLVHVPPPDAAALRRALDLAMHECVAKGITSLDDAGAAPDVLALYKQYADAGMLQLRVYAMLAGADTLRRVERPEIGLGRGFLTIRSVKLYADGALGSRGAALLEPYADDPGNSGFFTTPRGALLDATRDAVARGFQVCTHAIGDRANRVVLDVYEQVMKEHPEVKDPRLRIEHAQVLDAADIPRFARLGVIASMQGIHATSDRPWAASRLGMERVVEGAYAWQKLLKSGARIVNGTDAPVEDVDPIKCFHASVTRQDESGQPPGGFDPDQRMTRAEALRSYTLDPAYGTFQEQALGAIAVGRRADLTVLSKDILTVTDAEILRTEVLYTIVDGKVRYSAR